MKIEDLLAPDEVVKLRGPMAYYAHDKGFLWVTNRAVYAYCTKAYGKGWHWEIVHYQDVAGIELHRDDNENMCTIDFSGIGFSTLQIPNVTTAETVFCCIKREWSAAKKR